MGNNTQAHRTAFPDEQRIRQVLAVEKQAQSIHEMATRDAAQLPVQAEQEARALVEKARADAQEEARRLVANAQAEEARAQILAQTDDTVRQMEALAQSHAERAIKFVLDRVAGRG